jgi:drug/metabolite transporter (DMT)-like permease
MGVWRRVAWGGRVTGKASDLGGVAAMLAATAAFVVCDSFMKMVTVDLPPFEVLFLRGIAASTFAAVLISLCREWHAIAGALNLRTLLRAAAEGLSTLFYILALARMPIADVIAILQTAPLILILGAAVLFRERIGPARVLLMLVGFAGALMVAQPNASGIPAGTQFAFASALLVAARDLFGRSVPAQVPVSIVAFVTSLIVMAAGGISSLAFESWTTPVGWHLAFLGIAGLFVTLGQAGLILAYRLGHTALIAPFFYSFAVWGLVSGLVVWGALPNPLALLGIALIVASGVAIVISSRKSQDIELMEAL